MDGIKLGRIDFLPGFPGEAMFHFDIGEFAKISVPARFTGNDVMSALPEVHRDLLKLLEAATEAARKLAKA